MAAKVLKRTPTNPKEREKVSPKHERSMTYKLSRKKTEDKTINDESTRSDSTENITKEELERKKDSKKKKSPIIHKNGFLEEGKKNVFFDMIGDLEDNEVCEHKKKCSSLGKMTVPSRTSSKNNLHHSDSLLADNKKKMWTLPLPNRTPSKLKLKESTAGDDNSDICFHPPGMVWLGITHLPASKKNHEKKSRTFPSIGNSKEHQALSLKYLGRSNGRSRTVRHHRSLSDAPRGSSVRISKDDDTVRIKCVWDDDKRFVWVQRTVSVDELINAISDKYSVQVEVGQIKFRDPNDENDLMTITTEEDLAMLFESDRVEIFITRTTPPTTPPNGNLPCRWQSNESLPQPTLHIAEGYFCRRVEKNQIIQSTSPPTDRFCLELSELNQKRKLRYSTPPFSETSPDEPICKWIIPSSDLIIPMDAKPLGCGYFGEVRLGYWRRRRVACKKVFEKSFKNKTDIEIFCREVKILSELRHPNIVLFLGACTDGKEKIIVTEYCEGGSLAFLLKNEELDEVTKLKIAKDVALGMNHLHFENVLHRDLTSSNILLSTSKEAKVCDFGLSRRQPDDTSLSCTMGSVAWMAPEVIENAKNFTKKSDVYSYGVLLWELRTRGDPCPPDMSSIMLATKVLHEQYRPTLPHTRVPSQWAELIKKCWNQNPDDRPTFDEILVVLDTFDIPHSEDQ